MASSSRLIARSTGMASGAGGSARSSSGAARWAGSRCRQRRAPATIRRAIPHNQAANLWGSRKARKSFQATMKVSWARSSLWLRLPVAL
ncbi:MAG: hypothetical protein NTZ17_04280 [Phycisphaerae bacterium]|nr:hypothetical protein [Phycisphaerae bacterium]